MRTMIPLGKIMRIIEGDLREPRQCVLVIEEDGRVRVVTELEADAVRKGWEITEEVPGLEGVAESEADWPDVMGVGPNKAEKEWQPPLHCQICGLPYVEEGKCLNCGAEVTS